VYPWMRAQQQQQPNPAPTHTRRSPEQRAHSQKRMRTHPPHSSRSGGLMGPSMPLQPHHIQGLSQAEGHQRPTTGSHYESLPRPTHVRLLSSQAPMESHHTSMVHHGLAPHTHHAPVAHQGHAAGTPHVPPLRRDASRQEVLRSQSPHAHVR